MLWTFWKEAKMSARWFYQLSKITSKNKSLFQALIVMLFWGSLFPMVKHGYEAYDISTVGDILFFAGIRFTICGFLISLYAFIKDSDSFKVAKSKIFPVLMSGLFAIILHYSYTYSALKLTDSLKTAILKQVGVLFYVSLSSLFFKDDKLTVKKLLGAILGFLGLVAINSGGGSVSFNAGDALIIAASFCMVFSNVISKKVFATVNPITATGISQLFGGVALLVLGKILGGTMSFNVQKSYVLVYICIASIISYCIWYIVVKKGELSHLFIIKFAEPAFACIFGALILGENIFKIQYLISYMLISTGIYISNKHS